MSKDDRIIELLAEMVFKQDLVVVELKGLSKRVENLEHQQANTNLGIGELRLSFMNLADKIQAIAEHEKRIDALERAVFKG